MRYVAAYLLAQLGGHNDPSAADIKKILGSVGIDFDEDKAKKVIDSLKGKNVEELIEKGKHAVLILEGQMVRWVERYRGVYPSSHDFRL